MPSHVPKSATLLTIALAFAGCATSPSWITASSRKTPDRPARTFGHDGQPPIRLATFELPEAKASQPEIASAEPLREESAEPLREEIVDPAPVSVAPQDVDADGMRGFTLDSLIALARTSNPSISQVESAVAQATAIHCQVGLKPNPSIGYFGQELGNDASAGQHGVFASQTFVRGDKLQWNRCVTSQDVNRLKWEAETQRWRVETDVRVRFYRALAAQRRLQRAKEFRVNASKGVDVARQRLEAKEGTKPDLLESQLLVDQIDLSIRRSELDWQAAWAELAATIGQPALQPDDLIGDFLESELAAPTVLLDEAMAASPELSAARARIARTQSNLQRQRNQAIPNLNLQMGVGVDDATDDSFANVQLGLPIPVHNRNQGNIAAARSELSAANENLRRLSLRLKRDMADAYRRYQSAAVAIKKFEQTMLPRAEESLRLVEEARRAGEIGFLRVLNARQTVFNLQQELISAKSELSQAAAEISGYMLSDALGNGVDFDGDDGLRGQALGGQ